MDDFIKYLKFVSLKDKAEHPDESYIAPMKKTNGVYEVTRTENTINIGFNMYVLSDVELIKMMAEVGFIPYPTNEGKGNFSKWLDKLAKDNKKEFGSERLDCCDLNN